MTTGTRSSARGWEAPDLESSLSSIRGVSHVLAKLLDPRLVSQAVDVAGELLDVIPLARVEHQAPRLLAGAGGLVVINV
ncbi:hypothetical protein E4U09_001163 [Claviceps aff. purpurea]|uniref:Uncharacterized protein n=1 Tax=Claviceps aff. purpurea TaxID=1967640 RepID=A0A9P7U508_9HYPO|nr:hypothetical protein E4U09_001163 [Claviceps aff. purpurea]